MPIIQRLTINSTTTTDSQRSLALLEEALSLPKELLNVIQLDDGHMAYHHLLVTTPHDSLFVKQHDKMRYTDPTREIHSRKYLQKEARIYDHLRLQGFTYIPRRTNLADDHTLIMDALHQDDGWAWRAPRNELLTAYIKDSLQAFRSLSTLPITQETEGITPSITSLENEGWRSFNDSKLRDVKTVIESFIPRLHPESRADAKQLVAKLTELCATAEQIVEPTELVLSHHDARQANIAWHPDHQSQLVDWSWAGAGRAHSDSTAFLIDLTKSGHDVSDYMAEHFNPDHALILIGFWLGHSTWPAHNDDKTVRFQQVASAVNAYRLWADHRQ